MEPPGRLPRWGEGVILPSRGRMGPPVGWKCKGPRDGRAAPIDPSLLAGYGLTSTSTTAGRKVTPSAGIAKVASTRTRVAPAGTITGASTEARKRPSPQQSWTNGTSSGSPSGESPFRNVTLARISASSGTRPCRRGRRPRGGRGGGPGGASRWPPWRRRARRPPVPGATSGRTSSPGWRTAGGLAAAGDQRQHQGADSEPSAHDLVPSSGGATEEGPALRRGAGPEPPWLVSSGDYGLAVIRRLDRHPRLVGGAGADEADAAVAHARPGCRPSVKPCDFCGWTLVSSGAELRLPHAAAPPRAGRTATRPAPRPPRFTKPLRGWYGLLYSELAHARRWSHWAVAGVLVAGRAAG